MDLVDLLSVRMLPALKLVFSLPVLVSAGAAQSGVSTDPDVDISRLGSPKPLDVRMDASPNAQLHEQSTADNLSTGMTPVILTYMVNAEATTQLWQFGH